MKGRWNFYRRELSFVLILVMIVSLLSQMSQGAEAKTNAIDYMTEVIDYNSELITASPVSEITTLDTEPLRAGISILTDGVSELLSKDAISEGLFRTGISTVTSKMTVDSTTLNLAYNSTSGKVSVLGAKGSIRADRVNNVGWLGTIVNGTAVTITVTKNTSTKKRTGYVDITDMGSGQTIRITVNQSGAPATPTPKKKKTPTPTKKPTKAATKTPTPKKPTNTPTSAPKLTADKTSISFGYAEGSQSVTISNNKGKLEPYRNPDSMWFGVSVSGTKVTISTSANGGAARTGYLDIADTGSGQTVRITVKQSAKPTPAPTKKVTPTPTKKVTPTPTKKPSNTPTSVPKLIADKTSVSFGYAESSQSVIISNNVGRLEPYRNPDSMWFGVSVNGTKVTISASANDGAARTGYLDIADTGSGRTVRITVKQSAKPTPAPTRKVTLTPTPTKKPTNTPTSAPKLTANTTILSFSYAESSQSVIFSNKKGSLQVYRITGSMWVSGSVNDVAVTITVETNAGADRTGYIDVVDTGSGQTVRITVKQSAKPTPTPTPKMTADKTSLSFSCDKSSQSVVISNKQGKLLVYRNTDSMWFGTSVDGNKITIEVSSNKGYASRTGYFDIVDDGSNQTIRITVVQKGAPTPTPTKPLTANPYSLLFTSEKSSEQITLQNVYSDSKIVYNRNTDAMGWVTVSGSGSTYTIEVLPNTTGKLRKGTVTFSDTKNGRHVDVIINQSNIVFCHVSFEANGGFGQMYMQAKSVEQGKSMEGIFPKELTPPDYKVFGGWYDQPVGGKEYTDNSMAPYQKELKLYAHWVDKNYVIVFNGNGENNGRMENLPASTNKKVQLPLNKYIKTGFVFDEWNTKRDGSGTSFKDGGTYMNIAPLSTDFGGIVTLYAQWSRAYEVQVSFNLRGGYEDQIKGKKYKKVIYGEAYGELPSGLKHPDGLIFDGWETYGGQRVFSTSKVLIKDNHTLYARWRENKYTIHFDGNGNIGGSMKDMKCKYGAMLTLPDCGFDNGIMFDCWCTKPDGTGLKFEAGTSIDALIDAQHTNQTDITLYALWYEKNVTFDYYEGFNTTKWIQRTEKNEVIHRFYPPEGPKVSGLRFVGWSKRKPDDYPILKNINTNDIILWYGQPNIVEEKEDKFIKVYAIYEPIVKEGQVGITYVSRGGTGIPEVAYYSKNEPNAAKIPVSKEEPHWDRHLFKGWALDPEGVRIVSTVDIRFVDSVIILYASWDATWTTLTLRDGYTDRIKEELIESDSPYYLLESLKRDDYAFAGWKSSSGKVYQAGEKVYVPEGGLTLTAQWDRIEYTFEYIDTYSGKVLKEETLYSDSRITGDSFPVVGKNFIGWTNVSDLNQIVYSPGTVVSDIITHGLNTHYKLKTAYVAKEGTKKPGKFTVCYYMNGGKGGPTAPTYGDLGTGELIASIVVPTRDNCMFAGWSTVLGGEPKVKAGGKMFYTNRAENDEVILYACWESNYKCILDKNDFADAKIGSYAIKACPGEEIDLSNYKNLFGNRVGYYLLGWGTDKETAKYGTDDKFVVPAQNTTLYAIWRKEEYKVVFCDSFTKEEITRKKVLGRGSLTIPTILEVYEQVGYEFTGWSTSCDRLGQPLYKPGDSIDVSKDIILYATYKLSSKDANSFTIRYMDNGGKNGPGMIGYKPGTIELSDKKPEREGYTFLGWDTRNMYEVFVPEPEYPKGKKNVVTGSAGEDMILYAVWKQNSINEVKLELEKIYGKDAIKDEFFDQPYESSDWERINDKAYYVVRTENLSKSHLYYSLSSTVFVMEYKNGKWYLKAYGAKERLGDTIRLDILCAQTNNAVQIMNLGLSIVNAIGEIGVDYVSVYCPAIGVVVKGIHYLDKAAALLREREEYDYLIDYWKSSLKGKAKQALIDKGKGKLDGKLLGEILGELSETTGIPKEVLSLLVDLFKTTEDSLREEIASGSAGKDPFGEYDKAIALFTNRLKDQKFCPKIRNNVPKIVAQIYKYVNYNELK